MSGKNNKAAAKRSHQRNIFQRTTLSCAIAAVFAGSAMQAQANALPALNFPRPGLVDATDSVRPVTLRGLSPDQVLVLVSRARCRSISTARVSGATWCFAAPVAA